MSNVHKCTNFYLRICKFTLHHFYSITEIQQCIREMIGWTWTPVTLLLVTNQVSIEYMVVWLFKVIGWQSLVKVLFLLVLSQHGPYSQLTLVKITINYNVFFRQKHTVTGIALRVKEKPNSSIVTVQVNVTRSTTTLWVSDSGEYRQMCEHW